MGRIKNIIFDFGGVLIDLDMPKCLREYLKLGANLDELKGDENDESCQQAATICDGMVATGILNLYQIGGVSTDKFLKAVQSICNEGTTIDQVLYAWNCCLLTIPPFKLDLIKNLRKRGYHVYLLSNTNDAHWQDIVQNKFPEPLDHYFDKVFVSHEMQVAKPNAEIFTRVLNEIGAEGDECLFLDDCLPNCEAAEALGYHTYKCTAAGIDDNGNAIRPEEEWCDVIDSLLS